ncbi:MAG: hypothetical protein AAFQ45_11975 [Pseudomonadota bacterium]
MEAEWSEIDHDAESGRRIFKRDAPNQRSGTYGTYDFEVAADLEVRDAAGTVLFATRETASGEYWCGVFLWFVKGTAGTQVRLDASNKDDRIYDVPDTPRASNAGTS